MNINKVELVKVDVSGTTVSTKVLDEGSPKHYHNIYNILTLGNKDTPSTFKVNGVEITLPAGVRFNDIPAQNVEFISGGGILLFIKKTTHTLF